MLDLKLLREDPERIKAAARKKHLDVDVDRTVALEVQRREMVGRIDDLRAAQNKASKSIGKLPPEERATAAAAVKDAKARLRTAEEDLRTLDEEFQQLLLRLPNPPADEVPEGATDQDSVEIRRVGTPTTFSFDPLDHVELGRRLDILDIERAGRISGSRQYILKGEGCLLEWAVLRMAQEHMVARGFLPIQVPAMVRREAMEGTAYFPGGEEQAYRMAKDDLYLIGTSEVPVTAFHAEEILDEADLPKRFVALSPCFRREAGTYGKDTRGLFRVHQFWKVEQVVIDRADEALSLEHHHAILQNSEDLMQDLELPYRVVNVCGGDLGQPHVQKFDVETWMPSREGFGETHSASRFHDFQARRLKLRYRDGQGKVHFCHTLNNTVIASPRVLIALLENHQREDGSVAVPEALRPYFGGREELRAV